MQLPVFVNKNQTQISSLGFIINGVNPRLDKSNPVAIFRPIVISSNRVWFDPQQGAVLGRIRSRRGQNDYQKKYRFTEQGVFRHRREPKNKKEAALSAQQWTDTKDAF